MQNDAKLLDMSRETSDVKAGHFKATFARNQCLSIKGKYIRRDRMDVRRGA